MGSPRIKDQILQYLSRHAGQTVWRNDMASDLGFTQQQITSAVGSVFRSDTDAKNHIVVVDQGRAWRWAEIPQTPSVMMTAKRMFEELTSLPDGRVLIQDDSRKVYWATEV